MGRAAAFAAETVRQRGFLPGQRVLLPSKHAATLGAWRGESGHFELWRDGASELELVHPRELRLETEGEVLPIYAETPPAEIGKRVVEAKVGEMVLVWRNQTWMEAAIIEEGGHGKPCHVVCLQDAHEVIVPLKYLKLAENNKLHQRRLAACALAKEKLEMCNLKRRRVSDSDVLEVLRAWAFSPNVSRRNVLPPGQNWVYSDTFGLINSRTGRPVQSRLVVDYPDMFRLLSAWLAHQAPSDFRRKFPFTSVNVNFDYAARLHRDGRNAGPSLLTALGSFTGGKLGYFPDDNGVLPLDALPLDKQIRLQTKRKWELIDGNRAHCVKKFNGERFSVVFFTCSRWESARTRVRRALKDAGAVWPTLKSIAHFQNMLPVPCGYDPPRRARGRSMTRERTPARSPAGRGIKRARSCSCPREPPEEMYRCLRHPHLKLGLKVDAVYSLKKLLRKCGGDRGKVDALRRKLHDPKTFVQVDQEE